MPNSSSSFFASCKIKDKVFIFPVSLEGEGKIANIAQNPVAQLGVLDALSQLLKQEHVNIKSVSDLDWPVDAPQSN